jgi:hypothetical protein
MCRELELNGRRDNPLQPVVAWALDVGWNVSRRVYTMVVGGWMCPTSSPDAACAPFAG